MKSKLSSILFAVALIFVLAVGTLAAWLFLRTPETPFPGLVVKSQPSPTGLLVASVLYDPRTENHFFAVQARGGIELIAARQIDPLAGYHSPNFKLSWPDNTTARVEVDWDFGEGNLVYEFNAETLQFEKKP